MEHIVRVCKKKREPSGFKDVKWEFSAISDDDGDLQKAVTQITKDGKPFGYIVRSGDGWDAWHLSISNSFSTHKKTAREAFYALCAHHNAPLKRWQIIPETIKKK